MNENKITPRKSYILRQKDGTSLYAVAIFRREEVEQYVGKDTTTFSNPDDDLAFNLTGWYAFERGIGRAFADEPRVIVGKRNIMVCQFRGLDV